MQRRQLLLALAGASALAACGPRKAFQSIDVTGVDYAKDFEMPDAHGQVRRLADFRGRLVVLFFGFTHCPDVCPTALAELAEVRRQLGPGGQKVQGIMVTVDPERDTPEVLRAYTANFDPGFVALRGSPEQLQAMARDFRVLYNKVEGKTPGSYTMDHTAASFVFDTQGRLRLYVRPGSGPKVLAEDLRLLLQDA